MLVDHPVGHVSFASSHGLDPFQTIEVPKLHTEDSKVIQMLWPDHCIQNSTVRSCLVYALRSLIAHPHESIKGCNVEANIQTRLEELGEKVHYIQKV